MKKYWQLITISTWALISRLIFIGHSTWHNDVADFINSAVHLAVQGDYLGAHSPDYPLWNIILAGSYKLATFFNAQISPVVTANFTTAILAIATIIIFYLLASKFWANKNLGFICAIIFSFIPVYWLLNEFALSETCAIFFLVSALLTYQVFLEKNQDKWLWLTAFLFALGILTRFSNIILLPLFVILPWLKKLNTKDKIIQSLKLAITPIVVGLLIYGWIWQWQFSSFLGTSRWLMFGWNDFIQTLITFWSATGSLIIISFVCGIYLLLKQKNWSKIIYLILPILICIFYFAGWWHNGSFDISRYLSLTAPWLALGTGLIIYKLWLNKKLRIILIIIIALFLKITLPSLSAKDYCQNNKSKTWLNQISSIELYCQIRAFHAGTEERADDYLWLKSALPEQAVLFVPSYEWIYPGFYSNAWGAGSKTIVHLSNNELQDIESLKNILKTQMAYLPSWTIYSDKFLDLINSQNWNFEQINQTADKFVLKISR